MPPLAVKSERVIKGDPAQADDAFNPGQQIHLLLQKRQAIADLLRRGLVLRRRAAADGGDIETGQPQPIPAVKRFCLVSKSGFIQSTVKENARTISGEHAPGAVRAMRPWRQTNHQQARLGIAEAGHRLAPILPVAVSAAALKSHLLTPAHQPGALATGYNS